MIQTVYANNSRTNVMTRESNGLPLSCHYLDEAQMKPQHPIFNHPTLLLLLKCNKTLNNLKQIHSHMITTCLIRHTYPLSKLLTLSSTLSITYTLTLFNQISNPSIFLYNTLISSSSNHHPHIAFSLYSQILNDKSLIPNNYTYPSLLKACGSHPWLHYGRFIHAHILKFLEPPYGHFVQASLLNYYSKCGKLVIARYLFDQIPQPDLATWNSMLSAYSKTTRTSYTGGASAISISEDTSNSIEALMLFNEMQLSLIRPNEVTIVALIGTCADLGALSQGIWAHAYVMKNNLNLNRFVGTALIEMYVKCGCLDLAIQLFHEVHQKDTLCYNAMIGGFAIHGHGQEAIDLSERMQSEGVRPDGVTILVVMCACAHAGLVEKGRKIFDTMKVAYRIEPKLEHYGSLVDLLGRAGQVKEAWEVVNTMPMKPNAVLWRSLLGACRVHGDSEIGELALKHLIGLEPESSGSYVLLSNMHARNNRWDDVKRVRKVMKDHGVDKAPGLSLIEIGGTIHEFMMGDKTHPDSNKIYKKLEEINWRLHTYGHKPIVKEVLFDIEDEEKEDALTCHSEKLAIAFALLEYRTNLPIRIIKNLRVCVDCHESTKLISKIYERDIILRDRNRFHHFRDGGCSCSDYW